MATPVVPASMKKRASANRPRPTDGFTLRSHIAKQSRGRLDHAHNAHPQHSLVLALGRVFNLLVVRLDLVLKLVGLLHGFA
jgi:hypothetical protein